MHQHNPSRAGLKYLCLAFTLNAATNETNSFAHEFYGDLTPQKIHDYMQSELEIAEQIQRIVVVVNAENFPDILATWRVERDFNSAPSRR